MTRQVLEHDTQGNPTVILFTESAADLAEDRQDLQEQDARAQEVARSLASA